MALLAAPRGLSADPPGSRSFLRGSGTATPDFRKGEKKMMMKMKIKNKKKKRESLSKGVKNLSLPDRVPVDVARVVVNMQQYYASGVGELAEKLGSVEEELRRAKEENVMMKKRLDMHFGMLGQTAEFMQRISEGLGGAKMEGEEMVGGGGEELNQGVVDDDGDGDLTLDGVDMEVPPTPVDDDRLPMRSTGRMASSRRMVQEKSPIQRRKGKEAKRRTAARVLPIRGKMVNPQDHGDANEGEVGANLESLREEQSHNECEPNDNSDGGEEDAKVLEGAPRLQEAIRQDAMQRAISRDLIRRSRFTPINLIPSRQSTPSSGDENSDSDEYRPSSPSTASCCSSFSSSESPASLYEEGITPSSTTTVAKPASPPNAQLPTPPLTASLSSSSSSTSSPRPNRYGVQRHTTEDRYASGPPGKRFKFHRMGRTVLDVWTEYKIGSKGNPAIEELERQYGTGWRTGGIQDLKYASNYVSVRQKVVRYVEEMCEREGISEREAMRRLDERVDGRMQMLISAVRKGQDPFVVIPKR